MPCLASLNIRDALEGDIVPPRQFAPCNNTAQVAYGAYIIGCQSNEVVSLAARVFNTVAGQQTSTRSMTRVIHVGEPFEIGQSVVLSVAVDVVDLISGVGRRSKKRKCFQSMNLGTSASRVSVKAYTPRTTREPRFENLLTNVAIAASSGSCLDVGQVLNTPAIADFVEAFPTDNGQPVFNTCASLSLHSEFTPRCATLRAVGAAPEHFYASILTEGGVK